MLAQNFIKNKITLYSPDEKEISQAFSSLPPQGRVDLSCAFFATTGTLRALENAGFFGMMINPDSDIQTGIRLSAVKGKDGPCFETGRTAIYTGAALAALDDDHHLLFGKMKVCEKTAQIYALPPYRPFVSCSDGEPQLLAALATEPVPFDCDTFEDDFDRLLHALPEPEKHNTADVNIIYHGPFKALILADGTLLRRGLPIQLPAHLADALVKSGECLRLSGELAKQAFTPENLKTVHAKQGSSCLFGELTLNVMPPLMLEPDYRMLHQVSPAMHQRLLKLITSNSPYFVTTGSDARDLEGCCPSDDVAAANRLVEAGILAVSRSQTGPESCPVGIYALAGEIEMDAQKPIFTTNAALRQRLQTEILKIQPETQSKVKTVLKWSLLAFVLVTVLAIFFKPEMQAPNAVTDFTDPVLLQGVELPFQSGILILQFHRSKRCDFCINMEQYTQTALATWRSSESNKGNLAFRLINMDLPIYQKLIEQQNIFTSSIVMLKIHQGTIKQWMLFEKGWTNTDNEKYWVRDFTQALHQFQNKKP